MGVDSIVEVMSKENCLRCADMLGKGGGREGLGTPERRPHYICNLGKLCASIKRTIRFIIIHSLMRRFVRGPCG